MITRRRALLIAGSLGCGIIGCDAGDKRPIVANADPQKRPESLLHLSQHVNPLKRWDGEDLFAFVNAMKLTELQEIGKGLGLDTDFADTKPKAIEAIFEQIVWQSSNRLTYLFKSSKDIDYHNIVSWCASYLDLDSTTRSFTSTFDLEQAIVRQHFVEIWNKLSKTQREQLLDKIDPENKISDRAAIVAETGAAALGALSTTVYFTGFAFYTTMSVVISTVAGWFGITLPFAAYMSASSTVAVLSGPIGWAIAVTLLGTAVAWQARADVKKTTAAVMQIHALKAGALYCNNEMD